MTIARRTLILISAIAAAFAAYTYYNPWEMVFDPDSCGESPIGFYRFQVVPYETTDYSGARILAGKPIGGVLDFAGFYLGMFDPCPK